MPRAGGCAVCEGAERSRLCGLIESRELSFAWPELRPACLAQSRCGPLRAAGRVSRGRRGACARARGTSPITFWLRGAVDESRDNKTQRKSKHSPSPKAPSQRLQDRNHGLPPRLPPPHLLLLSLPRPRTLPPRATGPRRVRDARRQSRQRTFSRPSPSFAVSTNRLFRSCPEFLANSRRTPQSRSWTRCAGWSARRRRSSRC